MSDLCLVATMLAKMQLAENNAVDLSTPPDRLSPSPKAAIGQKSTIQADRAQPEASFPELSGRSIDPQGYLCRAALLRVLNGEDAADLPGPTPTLAIVPDRQAEAHSFTETTPSTRPVSHDPGFAPKRAVAVVAASQTGTPAHPSLSPRVNAPASPQGSPVSPRSASEVAPRSASDPAPRPAPASRFTDPAFTSTSFTQTSFTNTSFTPSVATSAAGSTLASTATAPAPTAVSTATTRPAPATPAIAVRPQPSLNIPGFTLPPNSGQATPRFTSHYQGPTSGPQLYQQRRASLQAGRLYTRLPSHSFRSTWANASYQPNYDQWKLLLAAEARAVALGQGSSRLSVMLGDSLSLWMPGETLPQDRLWLNQGISGDTTTGMLQRLHYFRDAHPDTIYVMAGINDLLGGASDSTVVRNLEEIVRRLRQDHPQAEIVLQSILPTDNRIPNARIRGINQHLAQIAQQQGVRYLDLHPYFADDRGNLRRDFTTDGVHLTALGYGVWQSFWQQAQGLLAQGRSGRTVL